MAGLDPRACMLQHCHLRCKKHIRIQHTHTKTPAQHCSAGAGPWQVAGAGREHPENNREGAGLQPQPLLHPHPCNNW
jgi:hypothetical protein